MKPTGSWKGALAKKGRENEAQKLGANAKRRRVRLGPGKERWAKKGAKSIENEAFWFKNMTRSILL